MTTDLPIEIIDPDVELKRTTKEGDPTPPTCDDRFLEKEDRKDLLLFLKEFYKEKYPWADDILHRIMVRDHYCRAVKNMDIEQYKKDCIERENGFLC